jgi:uncharacterized protein (TIGR02118 family)
MIRVSILYPNTAGSRFDLDYYLNTHLPMTERLLAPQLRSMVVEHGIAGTTPGSSATYIAMCHLEFDSVEAFLEAFMPHMATLTGDIPNYTDVEAVIQFNEIKIARTYEMAVRN